MGDRHTRRASPRGGRERQRDKAHVRRLLQWSQTVRLDWEGLVVGAWGPAGSGSAAAAAPAGHRLAAAGSDSEAGAGGTADTKSQESSSVFILGAESEGRGGEGRAGVP